MPVLHLDAVPNDLYDRLQQLARVRRTTAEVEAVRLLREGILATQADLLADLRQRTFVPPPGTPDSVELLREDRQR